MQIKDERHAILLAASLAGCVGSGSGPRGARLIDRMRAAKELVKVRDRTLRLTADGRIALGRLSLGVTVTPDPDDVD